LEADVTLFANTAGKDGYFQFTIFYFQFTVIG
jgi:hypothetical protein